MKKSKFKRKSNFFQFIVIADRRFKYIIIQFAKKSINVIILNTLVGA